MSSQESEGDPGDGAPQGDGTSGDPILFAGWEVQQYKPPAVLCIRAVDFREPLVGRRARFWLTSFNQDGELIALGWRDGLRIVSEVQDLRGQVGRVVEPTVRVQEEADYYRALSGEDMPRLAAGFSRIWVEQYIGHAESQQNMCRDSDRQPNCNAWLADVAEDPGRPRVIRPVPARTVHALTGHRVIHMAGDGEITTDLRAAGESSWTTDGKIVVPVVDEPDWYLWASRSNNEWHPSLRTVEISSLWVES
ncbi:MAG TPA: hypothetical protein VIJ07_10060 [Dermatophilaceae bacterium]|jgi:hypothetical protein